jgi:NADH:ubiquinone oxidoreductase subunit 6 (subunit J)
VLSTCGLFLLQAAPFLMAATIIVYAGAIVVTFLFVIMLAQQEGLSSADQFSREPFLATVAGFVLLGSLLCVVHRTYSPNPTLDELLQRVAKALAASTPEGVTTALGDPTAFRTALHEQVAEDTHPGARSTPLQLQRTKVRYATDLLDQALRQSPPRLDDLHEHLREIQDAGRQLLLTHGSLLADETAPVSRFSGAPPSTPPTVKDGRVQERMPAYNVSALGRSLFSDYLLAIELAGVLLTVATIGAIVIAGRRTEGLR